MLSVRNMLTESQQQQQPMEPNVNTASTVTLNEQLHQKKPSVLNISSLLCSGDNNVPEQPIQLPKPAQFHQLPPLQTHQPQAYHYHYQSQQAQAQPQEKPIEGTEGEDSYVQMLWARQNRLNQPPFHQRIKRYNESNNNTPSSPTSQTQQQQQLSMPHSYYLLNKHQRRSSRQHQIESKKIEQELLHDRRKSSSSSSSSSSLIYSLTNNNSSNRSKQYNSNGEEDDEEEEELPLKAKRRRASSKQLDVLNKVFERTFFPSTQLRAELGRQLGMSPRTVQIWFQNRRQAIRTKERTDSVTSSSRENSISPE